MRLAAIDIGSNSIKLIVVEAATSDSFAVLGREKEVVRLGHNTLQAGYLAPEAIARAAATIKRYRSIAEARGAENLVTIATASVREARNADEFVAEVQRHAGARVEILSGVEEARLIGLLDGGNGTTTAPRGLTARSDHHRPVVPGCNPPDVRGPISRTEWPPARRHLRR